MQVPVEQTSGEKIIMHLHPARLAWIKTYIAAAVLILLAVILQFGYLPISIPAPYNIGLIALPVIAVILLFSVEVRLRFGDFTLTDRRVIEQRGFFSREIVSVGWDSVSSAKIRQSLIGRLFDIGDIYIQSTGGTDAPEIDLESVAHVSQVKVIIDKLIAGTYR